MSAIWMTGHAADRGIIHKQTVQSYCVAKVAHGKSRRRLHKRIRLMKTQGMAQALWRTLTKGTFKNKRSTAIGVAKDSGSTTRKIEEEASQKIRQMKQA